jgi:hypothetical protein
MEAKNQKEQRVLFFTDEHVILALVVAFAILVIKVADIQHHLWTR